MAFAEIPSKHVLTQLLKYNPETGVFTWKRRNAEMCQISRIRNSFNSRFAGKEAGIIDKDGYRIIVVNGVNYRAHRIAWVITYGEIDGFIDHINGDRLDNRISNLRCVDRFENQKNMRRSKRNNSGHVGVHWAANISKWSATIYANSKHYYLGSFDDIEDAISARRQGEIEHGFHENHGTKRPEQC